MHTLDKGLVRDEEWPDRADLDNYDEDEEEEDEEEDYDEDEDEDEEY